MNQGLKEFMNDGRDGVFVIGHASNLVRVGGRLILFDPAWNYQPFSEYWKLLPYQIDCTDILSEVEACIVSHIHDDHYDPKILKRLRCPVYVMGGRPEFEKKMAGLCKEFRVIPPGVRAEIAQDVCVAFVPSSFNPVDSSAFVWGGGFCFYHGNDNYADLKETKRLVGMLPKVDIATIPYAYLNWYPECMEDYSPEYKHRETERLVSKMVLFAEELTDTLGARKIIPAGANLYYADELDSPFNQMGISPWEFQRRVDARFKDKVFTGTAGDWLMNGAAFHGSMCRTENLFNTEVASGLKGIQPKNKTADVKPEPYYITIMDRRLKEARHRVPNHIVEFPVSGTKLCVNLETATCYYTTSEARPGFNTTTITIEPYQLKEWLEGRMTYEMVVATRKFKMRRDPDDYNVKVFEFILNYL